MSNEATAKNYDGLWGRQIKAEAERKRRLKEPTPRPWKWLPEEGQFIVDANYNIVAEIPCQSGNPADGKLIVAAVNERDALLAEVGRLREALEMTICHGCSNRIGFTGEGFVKNGDDWRKCPNCRKARAALSGKKEGEGNG